MGNGKQMRNWLLTFTPIYNNIYSNLKEVRLIMSNKILSYLFESNAIKFCKENEPFWLTSGKLSPYFFNSQYVYGGEKESTEFLNYITDELKEMENKRVILFSKSYVVGRTRPDDRFRSRQRGQGNFELIPNCD